MKIASWNINSIRTRLPTLITWIKDTNPDVVLLQELKCTNEQFPYSEIEDLGYNVAVHGQKSYNGVAILAKYPIEEISSQAIDINRSDEARYIEGVISLANNKAMRVASIYVPNGSEVGSEKFLSKLSFFDQLHDKVEQLLKYDEILIIGGDFNVAPHEIDVYDVVKMQGQLCFSSQEHLKYHRILNLGLIDAFRALFPHKQEFSWWDYRAGAWQHNFGMRIDHLLLSPEAAEFLNNSHIDSYVRAQEKASDHAPVVCELNLNK